MTSNAPHASVVLLDNYDSFVHNLARYLRQLGCETEVIRSDAITAEEVLKLGPSAVIISPGPCTPHEAGCSLEVVRQLAGTIPILGVCLGHQTIGEAFGGRIIRSPPVHGEASEIQHCGKGIFEGLPQPLRVGRYHSLQIDPQSLPGRLEVTATTADGIIMSVADRHSLTWGVQFHPESILTIGGYILLANFLRLSGIWVHTEPMSLSM